MNATAAAESRAIDRLFHKQGIKRNLRFEIRTTDAIRRLVARGLGVSLVTATPAGEILALARRRVAPGD